VKFVLALRFEGRPITEQNLSDWKAGGYEDWLAEEALRAQAEAWAENMGEMAGAGNGCLSEHLAQVLSLWFAGLLSGWNGEVTDEFERRERVLGRLRRSILAMRRSEQEANRFAVEQDQREAAVEEAELKRMEREPWKRLMGLMLDQNFKHALEEMKGSAVCEKKKAGRKKVKGEGKKKRGNKRGGADRNIQRSTFNTQRPDKGEGRRKNAEKAGKRKPRTHIQWREGRPGIWANRG